MKQLSAVLKALKPFADCAEQIDRGESDEEWAKFRLLVGDYRRAASVFAALSSEQAREVTKP